jgi:hypothetical protein
LARYTNKNILTKEKQEVDMMEQEHKPELPDSLPTNFKRNLFLFFCLYAALLVYASIFLHTQINYLRRLNREHGDYPLKGSVTLKAPFCEPYVAALWPTLEGKKFFRHKADPKGFTQEAIKYAPEIEGVLAGAAISDPFDLFLFLRSRGAYEAEIRAMELLYMQFGNRYTSDYIDYLYDYLYIPLKNSFDSCQIHKSEWLYHQLKQRLALFDFEPMGGYEFKHNTILLTNLLFQDSKRLHRSPDIARQYFPEKQGQHLHISTKVIQQPDTVGFESIRRYWLALEIFRKKEFIRASEAFSALKMDTDDAQLREICALMEIRCWFWGLEQGQIPREPTAVNRIPEIAATMQPGSLNSDAEYYFKILNQVRDQPFRSGTVNTYAGVIPPGAALRISRAEIIDALIEVLKIKKNMPYGSGEPYYEDVPALRPRTHKERPVPYTSPGLVPNTNKNTVKPKVYNQ